MRTALSHRVTTPFNVIPAVTAVTLCLGVGATASADLLIDEDFSSVPAAGVPAPDADNFRIGLSEDGDQGWKKNNNLQTSFNDATDELTIENGTSFADDTTIGNDLGFGQWNNDNSASTGPWFFEFDVTGFDFGAGEELRFVVRVYESTNPGAPFNDDFEVGSAGFQANVALLGQVETGAITSTGTFATGGIDLGAGTDAVGVGIWAVNPDGGFGESVTLGAIRALPVPEPGSLLLTAAGGLLLLRRRR